MDKSKTRRGGRTRCRRYERGRARAWGCWSLCCQKKIINSNLIPPTHESKSALITSDTPNHTINLSRERRFMFVIFRLYCREGWRLDPTSLPCKVIHEETHSSPSPSYRASSQWSSSSTPHPIKVSISYLYTSRFMFVIYRFEMLVRVCFVSIVYTSVLDCFFGSVFFIILTETLYMSFVCIIYLSGTWWVFAFEFHQIPCLSWF